MDWRHQRRDASPGPRPLPTSISGEDRKSRLIHLTILAQMTPDYLGQMWRRYHERIRAALEVRIGYPQKMWAAAIFPVSFLPGVIDIVYSRLTALTQPVSDMAFPITSWECLVLFCALIVYGIARTSKSMPVPPGPAGALPVIGHLFVMPRSHEWVAYQRWSMELGKDIVTLMRERAESDVRLGSDIICLRVMGKHIIVLNSLKATIDLFGSKVSIYSDRFVTFKKTRAHGN